MLIPMKQEARTKWPLKYWWLSYIIIKSLYLKNKNGEFKYQKIHKGSEIFSKIIVSFFLAMTSKLSLPSSLQRVPGVWSPELPQAVLVFSQLLLRMGNFFVSSILSPILCKECLEWAWEGSWELHLTVYLHLLVS